MDKPGLEDGEEDSGAIGGKGEFLGAIGPEEEKSVERPTLQLDSMKGWVLVDIVAETTQYTKEPMLDRDALAQADVDTWTSRNSFVNIKGDTHNCKSYISFPCIEKMAAEKWNKRSPPMSNEEHLAVENIFEVIRNPMTEWLQENGTRADKRLEEILLAYNKQWEAKEAQSTAQVEVQKLNAQVSMVQRLKVFCEGRKPLDLDGEEKRLKEEIRRKLAEQVDVTVPAIDWDKWDINYMK